MNSPNAASWELDLYAAPSSVTKSPSSRNYVWHSGVDGYHYPNIVIASGDSNNCAGDPSCMLYLAVSAASHHTDGIPYTMLATNDVLYVSLQDNQPQNAHVVQGHYVLFSFWASPNAQYVVAPCAFVSVACCMLPVACGLWPAPVACRLSPVACRLSPVPVPVPVSVWTTTLVLVLF